MSNIKDIEKDIIGNKKRLRKGWRSGLYFACHYTNWEVPNRLRSLQLIHQTGSLFEIECYGRKSKGRNVGRVEVEPEKVSTINSAALRNLDMYYLNYRSLLESSERKLSKFVANISRNQAIGLPDLPKKYADEVCSIPAVQRVIVVRNREGLDIWTVLDDEPRNQGLRDYIYTIEQKVLRKCPDAKVDFRLVNISEWPDPREVQLPEGEVICERGRELFAVKR